MVNGSVMLRCLKHFLGNPIPLYTWGTLTNASEPTQATIAAFLPGLDPEGAALFGPTKSKLKNFADRALRARGLRAPLAILPKKQTPSAFTPPADAFQVLGQAAQQSADGTPVFHCCCRLVQIHEVQTSRNGNRTG